MQSQNSELENYIVYTEEKTNYSNLSFKRPLLLSCQISDAHVKYYENTTNVCRSREEFNTSYKTICFIVE